MVNGEHSVCGHRTLNRNFEANKKSKRKVEKINERKFAFSRAFRVSGHTINTLCTMHSVCSWALYEFKTLIHWNIETLNAESLLKANSKKNKKKSRINMKSHSHKKCFIFVAKHVNINFNVSRNTRAKSNDIQVRIYYMHSYVYGT